MVDGVRIPELSDYSHFDRVAFSPSFADPVDRWFQMPDSRSVEEICYLATTVLPRYDNRGLVRIVDPMCGTGSAAVAAHRLGLDFVGIERDASRALYAAAKCAALSVAIPAAMLRRCIEAERFVTDIESDSQRATQLLAAAIALASDDNSLVSQQKELLRIVEEDLDGLTPCDLAYQLLWMDSRSHADLAARRPGLTLGVVSPPHPRTRASQEHDSHGSYQYAKAALQQYGLATPELLSTTADVADSVMDGLKTLLADIAMIEFETLPEMRPTEDRLCEAAGSAGWLPIAIVHTYAEAPDDPGRGRGGYVILQRDTQAEGSAEAQLSAP
jgi:hypothetical protein